MGKHEYHPDRRTFYRDKASYYLYWGSRLVGIPLLLVGVIWRMRRPSRPKEER